MKIKGIKKVTGEISVPGDKSISHRALIFSSLAKSTVEIEGLLKSDDILSTLRCLQGLGVTVEGEGELLKVRGKGLDGLDEPDNILNTGNSGTTARLLAGLLSGQQFHTVLTGDNSLRKRPMGRIIEPLRKMGALIDGRQNGSLLPLAIRGSELLPLNYTLPVASAQVKSALLIAALFARGTTQIVDCYQTRDHTERALRHLGVDIKNYGKYTICLRNPAGLRGERWQIPGDISAAAFFMVAAAIAPQGELYLREVGINPTRTGIIDLLKEMGAHISIHNVKGYNGEPIADLLIKGGRALRGIHINKETIPRIVDEVPILAVAGLFARGETVIRGAGELRLKESDRLKSITLELKKMGAKIAEFPDGLIIQGGAKLSGASLLSHGDHRIAMSLAIAALFAQNESVIKGAETVRISFPGFFNLLGKLTGQSSLS